MDLEKQKKIKLGERVWQEFLKGKSINKIAQDLKLNKSVVSIIINYTLPSCYKNANDTCVEITQELKKKNKELKEEISKLEKKIERAEKTIILYLALIVFFVFLIIFIFCKFAIYTKIVLIITPIILFFVILAGVKKDWI